MVEPEGDNKQLMYETYGQRDLTDEEMSKLTRQDKIDLAKPRLKIKRSVFDSNLMLMGTSFTEEEAVRLEEYGNSNGDLRYLMKLPECFDLSTQKPNINCIMNMDCRKELVGFSRCLIQY